MPAPRDPKVMDALHSSELEALKQIAADLMAWRSDLMPRLLYLEGKVQSMEVCVDETGEHVGALIGLLRAMPLSAWPGLTAGTFADLWEELRGIG